MVRVAVAMLDHFEVRSCRGRRAGLVDGTILRGTLRGIPGAAPAEQPTLIGEAARGVGYGT